MLPKVFVVILSWNHSEYTVACLESLSRLDYANFEVLVIDNGSTDGAPERIQQRFPDMTLFRNVHNLGFAEGNNIGIRYALEHGADYVLLLNYDAELDPQMLRILVEVAESEAQVGAVGPKIYYYDKPDVIWSAGGKVDRKGQLSQPGNGEVDCGQRDKLEEVDYVAGCAILAKRTMIEHIGFLDSRFFTYFEETDWCSRARRAGYKILYVPSAKMWHKIDLQARSASPRYVYYMTRNRLLFLKESGAGWGILLRAIGEYIRTLVSWSVKSEYEGRGSLRWAIVRGLADFCRGRFGEMPEGLA